MITSEQIVEKLGKKKAVEFMTAKKLSGDSKYDRDRGIKGRVKFRMCEHGVWVIDNYEFKGCKECFGVERNGPNIIVHDKEYFNAGTGTYGTTTEHRRYAKSQGMEEAG